MFALKELKATLDKRSAVRELRAMPQDLLNDLGITPDQIEDYANASVSKRAERMTKLQVNGKFPSLLRAGCPECCCAV